MQASQMEQSAIFNIEIEGQNNQITMDTVNWSFSEGGGNTFGTNQNFQIVGNIGNTSATQFRVKNGNNMHSNGGRIGQSQQNFAIKLDGGNGKVDGLICESNKVNTTELEGGAIMHSLQQNFIQQVNGQQFDGMKNSIFANVIAVRGNNSGFENAPVQKVDGGIKAKGNNMDMKNVVVNLHIKHGQQEQDQMVPQPPNDGLHHL